MMSIDHETRVCRICLSAGLESDLGQLESRFFRNLPETPTDYEQMMQPCRCSGTVGFIHRGCLLLEVQYKRQAKCPMCLAEYNCVRARWRSNSFGVYIQSYPWRTVFSLLSLLIMATLSSLVIYKAKTQGNQWRREVRNGSIVTMNIHAGRFRMVRRYTRKNTLPLDKTLLPPRYWLSLVWSDEPMWLSMLLQFYFEVLIPNLAVLLLFHWVSQQLNHFRTWTFRNQPELEIELIDVAHNIT